MKKQHLLGLSVLSGLLFVLAWPGMGNLSFLLFFAFLPLLAIEDHYFKKGGSTKGMRWYIYLAFLIWNWGTTWWLFSVEESLPTRLMSLVPAVFINSLFFTIVFQWFHRTRKRMGSSRGHAALVLYWLAFEYLHHRWELGWTWLSVGNGFADSVPLIQWYEFTGIAGGTTWVLMVNIFLYRSYRAVKDGTDKRTRNFTFLGLGLIAFVPLLISLPMYYGYEEVADPYEVVAVQPNIDPYKHKFELSQEEMLAAMLDLAEAQATPETDFFIFPETALPRTISERQVDDNPNVKMLREFMARHPQARMLIGVSSMQYYLNESEITPSARKSTREENVWFDYYNAGLHMEGNGRWDIYHKSKLVLGVEKMPFSWLLSQLDWLAMDLGGTTGTLGTQEERSAYGSSTDPESPKFAPVICYESVYGEYLGGYVRNGAELLFVITNDAWWQNTPGHKQHLSFSRLRAIEQRRSVARSANTGISCYINQRGDVLAASKYEETIALRGSINANSEVTFYAKHGDYLSRAAAFFSVLLLLWTFIKRFSKK